MQNSGSEDGREQPANDPGLEFSLASVPVDTFIDSQPDDPDVSGTAGFTFSCNKKNCAYKCKLDAKDWADCKSGKSYLDLADGAHVFKVKAQNPANDSWDSTPATYGWTLASWPSQTCFFDNFDRADNADLGGSWEKNPVVGMGTLNDIQILGNQLYSPANGDTARACAMAGAKYAVTGDIVTAEFKITSPLLNNADDPSGNSHHELSIFASSEWPPNPATTNGALAVLWRNSYYNDHSGPNNYSLLLRANGKTAQKHITSAQLGDPVGKYLQLVINTQTDRATAKILDASRNPLFAVSLTDPKISTYAKYWYACLCARFYGSMTVDDFQVSNGSCP
jgi:hypothetical protein